MDMGASEPCLRYDEQRTTPTELWYMALGTDAKGRTCRETSMPISWTTSCTALFDSSNTYEVILSTHRQTADVARQNRFMYQDRLSQRHLAA